MPQSIKVFAPATVANLSCGFDILGLAIGSPGDAVEMKLNRTGELSITITGDEGRLSCDPEKNTATVAVSHMLKKLGSNQGVSIRLHKQMPLGSGLGSSAASAAGAVYALNLLLDLPFDVRDLVPFAMEGERVACGAAHADNVAPSLLGGIVLVRSLDQPDIISLPVPDSLHVVVVHPHLTLMTKKSRSVVKKNIPLSVSVQQSGNVAAFVTALHSNDFDLLRRSAVDLIAEPYRSKLIPGYGEVREAAFRGGAVACGISGSGPSMYALCTSQTQAGKAGEGMAGAFRKYGILSDLYISAVNKKGVSITE